MSRQPRVSCLRVREQRAMGGLSGRHVLVGITGGIAAYKMLHLIRLLVSAGAEVKVVMTARACDFVTPLSVSALSQHPVLRDFYDAHDGTWYSHVELGMWADIFVIAPCTANTLAKLAMGIADNLLTTTYLSARCPVLLAPAMDLQMYKHPVVQKNIGLLEASGVKVMPAGEGFLASGLEGAGRLPEPEEIFLRVVGELRPRGALTGVGVLLTLGPTEEPIDPVRFLSNSSSGQMGSALAESLWARGATVECVAGPAAHIPAAREGLHVQPVRTASEMLSACLEHWERCQAGVMSAAVADYRVPSAAREKIKRGEGGLTLQLVQNPDIAATLGARKRAGQVLVGFALESHYSSAVVRDKMVRKGLELCVVNCLEDEGAGFRCSTNRARICGSSGEGELRPLESKQSLSEAIVDELVALLGCGS